MKALSMEQYVEIVDFVQKHHRFGWVEENDLVTEYSYHIKYVDSIYDSRDKTIWCIKFRGMGVNLRFSSNHFNAINPMPKGWKYNSLYDLCMAYLNGEFKPKKEFYIDKSENS
jgi:hypothetical protein